jgi:hypothetical protein
MRATRTAQNPILAAVFAALLTIMTLVSGSIGALADEVVPGTSAAGVVPSEESETGQNEVTCASIQSEVLLTSSGPIVWQADDQAEKFLDGLSATLVDSQILSWESEWPISAVIVRGNNSSHIYVYSPTRTSDEDLVAPHNVTGPSHAPVYRLTNVTRVTFCWHVPPPDLTALCMASGTALALGEVVSHTGPISLEDGVVDPSTLPSGVDVDYDEDTELVTFTAPFPVVMVVMHSSEEVVHTPFDPALPAKTSGTVHLDAPGTGDLALCGLTVTTTTTGPDPDPDPDPEPAIVTTEAVVPTSIASGGGPRTSTLLALFAAVAVSVLVPMRSRTRALWSVMADRAT